MQTADHTNAGQNADRLELLPGIHHVVSAGRSQILPHGVPTIWNQQGCLVFDYDVGNVDRLLRDCPLLPLIDEWSPNVTIHGRALFDLLRGVPCKKLDLYTTAPIGDITNAVRMVGTFCSISTREDTACVEMDGWQFTITTDDDTVESVATSHNIGTCGFFRLRGGGIRASSAGLLALLFGALVLGPLSDLSLDESVQLEHDFELHMPIAMPKMDQPAVWAGTSEHSIGQHIVVKGLYLGTDCYCGMSATSLCWYY